MTFNCVAATEFHKKTPAIKERLKWANKLSHAIKVVTTGLENVTTVFRVAPNKSLLLGKLNIWQLFKKECSQANKGLNR